MISALVALALSQCTPYVRSKVRDSDPQSHCLYWPEKSQIEWRFNDQGNPETTGDTEHAAVAAAFATWQTEFTACGSLTLQEGPRTSSRLTEYLEKSTANQNTVLWRLKSCRGMVATDNPCWDAKNQNCNNLFDCWDHSDDALAITTTSFNPQTGQILDADFEFNSPKYLFTTVDSPPCVKPVYLTTCVASDVQNTVTHEIGHALGLAHQCMASSTMYFSANPGETSKRVLDPGSKQFVCETYPKGGASKDCIIKSFDGVLGPPKTGCVAAPGGLLAALALLGLKRRRG